MKFSTVSAALLLLFSSAVFGQEYDIVFHRDTKAGDKKNVQMKFDFEDEKQFSVNGGPTPGSKKVKVLIDLTALREVLAVDKNGNSADEKLTVQNCQCTKDGESTVLFKPKDEISVKSGKPTQFTVNGSPAVGLQHTMLNEMFPGSNDESGTDDRIFGPGRKVKVGETWPINAEAAVAVLSKKMNMEIPKEAVKGSVKLVSAEPKKGVPCLQLSGTLEISAAGLPLPGAPPELKTRKFETAFKLGGDFPQDTKLDQVCESMEMNSVAEGGGAIEKDGQKAEITFHVARDQKLETTVSPTP